MGRPPGPAAPMGRPPGPAAPMGRPPGPAAPMGRPPGPAAPMGRPPGPAAVGRCELRALGTGVVILTTDPDRLEPARRAVEEEVAAIDVACSRFRDDSEVAAVNRGGGRSVQVGPVLIEAAETALRAARLTDGDVDPTVGEAI